MEIVTIYAVNQGDDDMHAGKPKWFFRSLTDAKECARGRGWYGSDAPVGNHKALIVDGAAYLLAQPKPVELDPVLDDEQAKKNKAVAKLSDEERKLLGIR